MQPDAETLQAARRVVTVVPNSKGINNNHIRMQSNSNSSRGTYDQQQRASGPVRAAPPRPSNPAPTPNAASSRPSIMKKPELSSGQVAKTQIMNRASRSPAPPPSQPPPVNQPVVRPNMAGSTAASNPTGGFRLPNPGGFRLPPLNQGT